MKTLGRSLAIACLTVGLLGCSGGRQVNGAGVAAAITKQFATTYAPAGVDGVDCPGSAKLDPGTTFACRAAIGGHAVDVTVVVVDDKGNVRFSAARPVVVVGHVEADLVAQLHGVYDEPNDKVDVHVHCPGPRVRVTSVGTTFSCDVAVNGTTLHEAITVADKAGNVTFRALQ